MSADAALSAYFAEAASWDADRRAQARRAARLLAAVAAAGWLCALAVALALAAVMPLKSVEPFVIRVDNSTGLVDVVPVYAGQTSLPQAVTRYFLDHYVTVCERFALATAESDYRECGAFHDAAMNQSWAARWARTNPASPLNVYRDGGTLRAEVSSVSFFTRASGLTDLAQVRYVLTRRSAAGSEEAVTHWIAMVQYAYGAPSKDPQTRLWNPLGFRIADFHAEPEVLPRSGVGQTADPVSDAAPRNSP